MYNYLFADWAPHEVLLIISVIRFSVCCATNIWFMLIFEKSITFFVGILKE